ncbi:MAG: high-potential iron-sulfur protein [Anaerolineae bacterium]|nr:high-potential iron-sulfur protein [Anaerolineae bacterium]
MMHYSNEKDRYSGLSEQNRGLTSRRSFLKRAVFIGAAGLITPVLLSACSGEEAAQRTETGASGTSPEKAAAGTTVCAAPAELSALESATRKALNYVDESPEPEKVCANCRFFKPPEANATCGGCEIVGGPIAPRGTCNTWAAQS